MGDASKPKSNPRSISRGAFGLGASGLSVREIASRADLEAQLLANGGPVSSAKNARSWLKTKGWMLTGERYSKAKLADVLFTVSLTTKLSAEANAAIRAVTYLIEDIVEEELSVSLASKIADKIVHDLSPPIDDFKSSITKAKDFLNATSQKHASELLNLQELTKGNTDLSKSLADTSEKIGQVSNP
jgi:hypothetical protein